MNPLTRRYATKKFDNTKKISDEFLDQITESFRYAPSGLGLEGRGLVVVSDPDVKASLLPHAYHQTQVTDCSHLLVLCRDTRDPSEQVNTYMQRIMDTRGATRESLAGYEQMAMGYMSGRDEQDIHHRLDKQVYIASGFLMMTCAHMQIDSCPMEGFDPYQIDEILNLSQYDFASVMLLPIGYRSQSDKNADLAKVRKKREDVVKYV